MNETRDVVIPVQSAKCVIQVKNFMGAIEFEVKREFSPYGSSDIWCFHIKKKITEFIDHRDYRKNYLITSIGLRLCSTGKDIPPGSTYNFSFHFKLGDKKEDHMTMYEPLHVSDEIKWTMINMGTEYPLPLVNANLSDFNRLAAHRVFLTPEESKYALEDAIFTCVAYYNPTDASEINKKPSRPPPPSVFDDMRKMFQSLEMVEGDVQLIASNGCIKTHKLLLVSRSDVFKRMFTIDSLEKKTGTVDLTDFRIDTLEDFVHFLSKDEVRNMREKAIDLFILSDKYNVQSLKQSTEEFLSENISQVNAYRLHDVCLKIKSDPIAKKLMEFFEKSPSTPDNDNSS